MYTLTMPSTAGTYPVHIGEGAIALLSAYLPHHEVLIVTDQKVKAYHLTTLMNQLQNKHVSVFTLSEAPERDKTLDGYRRLLDFALARRFSRQGCVLAFGGGAVGDFAGFFAATYMRGVDYLQLPTTLLAHDSSVGGKVALNHGNVKNVVGHIYFPKAVLYDLTFLSTLPKEEWDSGLGELIKHDLLNDGTLINDLSACPSPLTIVTRRLPDYIRQAMETKARYVGTDFYDKQQTRKFLNLGHTLGHAIESAYGVRHGLAVLYGLCFDVYLKRPELAKEYFQLFRTCGFFNDMPALDGETLRLMMVHDKKNQSPETLHFISLIGIGQPCSVFLTHDEFLSRFQSFQNEVATNHGFTR